MPWSYQQTIHLRHTDAAGLFFAPRLLEIAQDAFESLQASRNISILERLQGTGPILPTVHCEADFARPINLGDRIQVEISLARRGNRSFSLAYRFCNDRGEVVATAATAHVALDRHTGRATDLPSPLTGMLDDLEKAAPPPASA